MITELKPNQIFIFGSNLAGEHLGGAAKQAYKQFRAEWGVGEGLTGQSYAFPTLDKDFKKQSMPDIYHSVWKLVDCCKENPDKEFILTKVGCGIARYSEEEMKRCFSKEQVGDIKNLILPEEWK